MKVGYGPTRNIITCYLYNYIIKDYLGNVRMMLNEEEKLYQHPPAGTPVPTVSLGETAYVTTEDSLYTNISLARVDKPAGYPTKKIIVFNNPLLSFLPVVGVLAIANYFIFLYNNKWKG